MVEKATGTEAEQSRRRCIALLAESISPPPTGTSAQSIGPAGATRDEGDSAGDGRSKLRLPGTEWEIRGFGDL